MSKLSPTLQLACELIKRPSVTPKDKGCQTLMRQRLEAIGFDCQTLTFGESDNMVENLWAVKGSSGPILCFAGHTDVVPTGPESRWQTPPFDPVIKNGILYGRGAADMKGSLAAMITACEAFVATHPNYQGRIAFLITADEEGPAINGTIKVVEHLQKQGTTIDWCIVGEPSSTAQVGDVIKNGRRGSLGAVLTVQGQQGHVAYPHLADNPIHRLAPALTELTQKHWDNGNSFFPATCFQVSNIHGGTGASNVIPGTVEVVCNFRFSTEVTAEELQNHTETILKKHQLNYDIQWNLSGQPFLTAEGKLVTATVNAIKAVTGRDTELSTAGGTSDGRFIAPTGSQVIELGPVNATIHQVDECIKADDLDTLSQIYQHILKQLLV
ncbi:succinyl-diaminopimelate desuccinylase [Candidatus Endobugula sertula]|uniref:Succinyl-diaminopimelate desuccinylase n=1 Tax=Candidatus Endobugula sertula TaxID=62101 RepID=A0A1D2QTG6_9GAMM|nr:succinyl-diaminopimelate desuccinylase [Candidatus Endobugula sertula]